MVGCTETISERHLIPVLQAMLHQFPFRIPGFHCDNGSEFLNYKVVDLLNKLLVEELPSAMRICHYRDQLAGEAQASLPPQGLSNTVREAHLIGALPDNTMSQERCGNAGAVESVESQKQASHFPTAPRIYRENQRKAKAAGLRPPPVKDDQTSTKGDLSRQPGRRHFQAHAGLEWNRRFRLMAYWNQFSISASFVDWKIMGGVKVDGVKVSHPGRGRGDH